MSITASGTGNAHRDAVGDRVGTLPLDAAAGAPRGGHRVGTCRADANHPNLRRMRLHPAAGAGQQRAVSQRQQERVEAPRVQQLAGNRAGAFCDRRLAAIFDEAGRALLAKAQRFLLGRIEIGPRQSHLGAERQHAFDLQRIGHRRREHHQRPTAGPARPSHGLPEVASARAHQRAPREPRRCSCAKKSAPRPLNERSGFIVSTFKVSAAPNARESGSQSYCGVSLNIGSISVAARSMRASESRWGTSIICMLDVSRSHPSSCRVVPPARAALPHCERAMRLHDTMDLDDLDRAILDLYQRDTRQPSEQIGAQVGLSAAAVQRRLKRLRENGAIVAETAALDPRMLGLGLTAIVNVDLVDESARATPRLSRQGLRARRGAAVLRRRGLVRLRAARRSSRTWRPTNLLRGLPAARRERSQLHDPGRARCGEARRATEVRLGPANATGPGTADLVLLGRVVARPPWHAPARLRSG